MITLFLGCIVLSLFQYYRFVTQLISDSGAVTSHDRSLSETAIYDYFLLK